MTDQNMVRDAWVKDRVLMPGEGEGELPTPWNFADLQNCVQKG